MFTKRLVALITLSLIGTTVFAIQEEEILSWPVSVPSVASPNTNVSGATIGDLVFDTTDDDLMVHDGTSFIDIATGANLDSGTYSPTYSIAYNLDSVSTSNGSPGYMRVGSTVSVHAMIDVDANTASTAAAFRISLPIASDLAYSGDLAGTCTYGVDTPVRIGGDAANDNAVVEFVPNSTSSTVMTCIFSYQVL